MNRTRIPYGTHLWPILTGCSHTVAACPTMPTCWARGQHRRFKAAGWARLYDPDFYPQFNPSELDAPRRLKKPARILVAFTGDLFSQEMHLPVPQFRVRRILEVVEACPRHSFVFLTKNPFALPAWNPWPSNAWVGTSITGAETPERQVAMMKALERVEGAGVRWISYEPLLAMPYWGPPPWLDWMVVGKASGPGAVLPIDTWAEDLLYDAELYGIPVWLKEKTGTALGLESMKELP